MLRTLQYLSVFWIGVKISQAKVLLFLMGAKKEDEVFYRPDLIMNFPNDEEINKYGRLAVEKSLEEN